MTSAGPAARIGLAVLAVVAAGAWILHLDLALRGRLAWAPIYVTPATSPTDAPQVSSFWPETPASATDLRPGDRLISVGQRSLVGASRMGVLAALYGAADASGRVDLEVDRAGETRAAFLELRPYNAPWSFTPVILGLWVAAVLIALRSDSRAGRAFAWMCLAYATHWAAFLSGGEWRTGLGLPLYALAIGFTGPLALRAFLLFPGAAREPRWPWLFLVIAPLLTSWQIGAPLAPEIGLPLLFASYALLVVCILAVVARVYVRSDVRARRQLRWIALGLYLALVPIAAAAVAGGFVPAWRPAYEWSLLALLFMPVCLTLALVRYNLFDIDRLISVTASYSLLGVVALAFGIGVAPRVAAATSRATSVDPNLAQGVFALAIGAGLFFGGRALRPRIEGFFFRERRALDEGVRELRVQLRGFDAPGPLFERLGTELSQLLGLTDLAIYARTDEHFVPVFGAGASVAPSFDVRGRLAALVEDADRAIPEERWRRWQSATLLEEVEAASLEALDAQLLLPIRGDKHLQAFLVLGEKASGDVYTPVDLALLEGLAEGVALQLERFDAAAIVRVERERQERLAGYVPAAVRDALSRASSDVPAGEQEVSVLFVDIRGYTGFSEQRRPDEIFQVVSAYTAAVSDVVREHQGWVVDFQGDGLMAVFGAPRRHPQKEAAAVRAALTLVHDLSLEEHTGEPLTVGVGVATGPAYVGHIQSSERRIWCVLGNTTNLAARLQSLTRDLGVEVVIDDATRNAAGEAAARFESRPPVRVRGRSTALPLHVV
ncbi:MAG: adenylate/guanylate cyclase domain-containing protein [Myxococcota bacterium]